MPRPLAASFHRSPRRRGYAVISALALMSLAAIVVGILFRHALVATQRATTIQERAQLRQLHRAGEILLDHGPDPASDADRRHQRIPLPAELRGTELVIEPGPDGLAIRARFAE